MALSSEDQQKIIDLYCSGVKVEAIAAQYNISASYPRHLAQRSGIPPRRRGYDKVPEEVRAAIYADYCEGRLSVREIAEKYGVSPCYPTRLIIKLGGPKRYNGVRKK